MELQVNVIEVVAVSWGHGLPVGGRTITVPVSPQQLESRLNFLGIVGTDPLPGGVAFDVATLVDKQPDKPRAIDVTVRTSHHRMLNDRDVKLIADRVADVGHLSRFKCLVHFLRAK